MIHLKINNALSIDPMIQIIWEIVIVIFSILNTNNPKFLKVKTLKLIAFTSVYSSTLFTKKDENMVRFCLWFYIWKSAWFVVLKQGMINYKSKSRPPPIFVNKLLLEHTHIYIYLLSMADFVQQQQNEVSATETQWPANLIYNLAT